MMKKYCTKCGREFHALGREVICPTCKASAAMDAKRAAVLKAKRASWTGESVPVRISGRASTVIREYGASHNLPFAAALDALLQASDYVKSSGKAWEAITPYKSRRRDKTTATSTTEDATDAPQEVKQDVPQDAKTAAKAASKATASKASKVSKMTGKAASKASASASKK